MTHHHTDHQICHSNLSRHAVIGTSNTTPTSIAPYVTHDRKSPGRCDAGAHDVQPGQSPLVTTPVTPGWPVVDYVEVLLQTACDDDPQVLERHQFHLAAKHSSESATAELVLAHLMAVVCSAVDLLVEDDNVDDTALVITAVHMTPHAVDPDMLMSVLQVGLGSHEYLDQISVTREWIEAAAIMAFACLLLSTADIDWNQPLVESWTRHDPRWFLSWDALGRLSALYGSFADRAALGFH